MPLANAMTNSVDLDPIHQSLITGHFLCQTPLALCPIGIRAHRPIAAEDYRPRVLGIPLIRLQQVSERGRRVGMTIECFLQSRFQQVFVEPRRIGKGVARGENPREGIRSVKKQRGQPGE